MSKPPNDTIPPSRKPRAIQRMPVAQLESVRKRLDRTPAQFSVDLGYTINAYPDWLRSGTAPKVASLAAEALARRQAATDIVFLVRVVKGIPEVTAIEDPESATIAGRKYLMVPT